MERCTCESSAITAECISDEKTVHIALLGQPNAGKSTLFNALTGSKQHVGNWPGKTVEQKTGSFSHNGKEYNITDLPGSYSLSANSAEEIITREFIASGQADLVCILADASQLERSLFMLADYIGINCPAMLIINMVDVAEKQGKKVNPLILQEYLGIPVVAMSASDKKDYGNFFMALEKTAGVPFKRNLVERYREAIGDKFDSLCSRVRDYELVNLSPEWIASKILENDRDIILKTAHPESILDKSGIVTIGSCKFAWINDLLKHSVSKATNGSHTMGRFDRVATSRVWGRPLAVLILVLGLITSFVITIPVMMGAMSLPEVFVPHLNRFLESIGVFHWLISLIGTLASTAVTCVGLLGFIAGSAFVFGLMEDVGYMARVSYVFESLMSRFKLHGKSVMAFMMSFGCSIGGSLSSRVIDSWGQRVLTMAMAWVIPCAGSWGVISVFGTAFFGINTVWILLALFASSVGIMFLTARIFAPKLINERQHYGLIMELPPYHSPKWGSIFRFVFSRMGGFAKKAFTYLLAVTAIFWALAYTSDGNIENSLIYKFGIAVEPVTMWFGLRWQTFVAFLCSMMGKEGALGALSSIFGASSQVVGLGGEVSPDLASQMSLLLTKAEALAFMFAFYFNIPCLVAVLQVKEESHSWKWTLRMIAFYVCVALVMSALAYYVGRVIF